MYTKIYTYGAKLDKESEAIALEELFRAHRYRNQMVEDERTRRSTYRQTMAELMPKYSEALHACAEAYEVLSKFEKSMKSKGYNPKHHKKTIGFLSVEEAEELMRLRSLAKQASKTQTAFRNEVKKLPAYPEVCKQLGAAHKEREKRSRSNCGVGGGTYSVVQETTETFFSLKNDPRFRPFDGTGRISVQIQDGPVFSTFLNSDFSDLRPFSIGPALDGTPWRNAVIRMGSRKEGRLTRLKFRTQLHRMPPETAVPVRVWLIRKKVGINFTWELQVTLKDSFVRHDLQTANNAVAVDVGWRRLESGLRVAYWVGSDGDHGQLIIPNDRFKMRMKSRSLSSIRDRNMAVVHRKLLEWLKDRTLPEAQAERFKYVDRLQSCEKLSRLVWWWMHNRFEGDESMLQEMVAWRKQERHLHAWQDNQSDNFINWRKDFYRKFACSLSRRYRLLVLEDCRWGVFQREPDRMPDGRKELKPAEYCRQVAAVYSLGQMLQERISSTLKADPAWTTIDCHNCGFRDKTFDPEKNLTHVCPNCGEHWDQDYNACLNLLRQAANPA